MKRWTLGSTARVMLIGIGMVTLAVNATFAASVTIKRIVEIPNPYSGTPYDLDTLGATDWYLCDLDEKAATTDITKTQGSTDYGDSTFPYFSYADGDITGAQSNQLSRLIYNGTPTFQAPASTDGATYSLWLGDRTAQTTTIQVLDSGGNVIAQTSLVAGQAPSLGVDREYWTVAVVADSPTDIVKVIHGRAIFGIAVRPMVKNGTIIRID